LNATCEDADDERVKVREAGGDDREVLRYLYAQDIAPEVVREVVRSGVAVEEGQLNRNGDNDARVLSVGLYKGQRRVLT